MKARQILGTMATVMLVAWMAVGSVAAADYTEQFDQSYDVAADVRLSLDNVNGDVTIEAWDQPQVWVRAEKSASSRELLDELKIKVDASTGAIDIETDYPNTTRHEHLSGRHMEVVYQITVPRGAHIAGIDLVNGDLAISGTEGSVHADTVNGTITVTSFAGEAELESVNGVIELHCGFLQATDHVKVDTVNGHVRIHLPSSASARIGVETVNGHISNDFGLEVRKHKYVGADLRGTVGGGGAEIDVETVNGGVEILRD